MKITPLASPALHLLLSSRRSAAIKLCSSSSLVAPFVVEDTAGALQLAEAVNCSLGSFDVEWVGSVMVEETIRVFGGTTLRVKGAAGGASFVDGAKALPLFELNDGTLHLSDLTLINGNGILGGAIYATNSVLTATSCVFSANNASTSGGGVFLRKSVLEATDTSFTGNTALTHGGAIHAELSNLTLAGRAPFARNNASYGGAVWFSSDSSLFLTGDNVSFVGNDASVHGGGLCSYDSTIYILGTATFVGNTASSGGASYMGSSELLVDGGVSFENNFVTGNAGGIYSENSDIGITGNASWTSNRAGDGGAGVTLWNSTMEVSGKADFIGNNATFGGAIYMDDSELTVNGAVYFAKNSVQEHGGAISSYQSDLNIAGVAVWEYNEAGEGGGGLSLWTSNTKVSGKAEFIGNTAITEVFAVNQNGSNLSDDGSVPEENRSSNDLRDSIDSSSDGNITTSAVWSDLKGTRRGGGIMAWLSTIEFSGEAEFVDNTAAFGGAIYFINGTLSLGGDSYFGNNSVTNLGGAMVLARSGVTITGHTRLENNRAGNGGGGISTVKATLQIFDKAEFVGNTASYGGAAYMANSTVLVAGDLNFTDNSVDSLGGAVYSIETYMNITGNTVWDSNRAGDGGGGMSMWVSTTHVSAGGSATFTSNSANEGGGLLLNDNGIAVIEGRAQFTANSAELGGAMNMMEYSGASFIGGEVTMSGNNASSSGGAMHCESTSLLLVNNTRFVSNFAGVSGGAITTLLAGTAQTEYIAADPAIFSNCSFVGNTADDAGGALFVGGGFVDIRTTEFLGNTAGRSGGALIVSGIVSLSECVLAENRAFTGPAVSNTVTVSVSSTEFTNNTLLCSDGFFLDWTNASAYETACDSCLGCSDCNVTNADNVQICTAVFEHTSSEALDGTLESLDVSKGYWRSSDTSREILECYDASACVGGTESYCDTGYEGPFCAVCADGYATGLEYTCMKCNGERFKATIAIAVALSVIVILTIALSASFMRSRASNKRPEGDSSGRGFASVQLGFKRARASQALKIIVVCWQIITQFSAVASVTYPDLYETFLKYIEVVNFNLGWMLSVGCVLEIDFYDDLMVSTIGPLVIAGFVLASYILTSRKYSAEDIEARSRLYRRHMSVIFWVSFLVYATASSAVFQTFACDHLDNGMSYLRVDHSLQCYTIEHHIFMVYAGIMGVVYPFGVPFCYALLLYRGREALKSEAGQDATPPNVTVLRELSTPYHPDAYFYEVVECFRRVVLSGIVVFIFPNTAGQVATTFLLALVFAACFMVLDPYTDQWDTWLARIGHAVIMMTMFVALLQKVDIEHEDDFSQDVFAGVLVVGNCIMMVAVAVEACGMCMYTVKENYAPVVPTMRYRANAAAVENFPEWDSSPQFSGAAQLAPVSALGAEAKQPSPAT